MARTYILTLLSLLIASASDATIRTRNWIYDECVTPDQNTGKCKPIWSCKHLIEYINDTIITNEIASTLRQYTCSNRYTYSKSLMVCCPPKPLTKKERRIRMDPALIDHSKHRNAHLLPTNNCGQANEAKVIGGGEAELFEFPWMAAIKYRNGNFEEFACGGTLINNRYVLTAAHCIRPKNKEMIGVRLGEYDFSKEEDCLNDDYFCTKYQDFSVSLNDVIVHPNYNPNTLENDIALIRLRDEPDTDDYSVGPICLPITIAAKMNNAQNYTVIGWGNTGLASRSNILLKTQVPSQNPSRCSISNSLRFKQICAGGVDETDVCFGDSGGPVMALYSENGRHSTVQYGVISRGPTVCAKENVPSVHTKIAAYMGWILDNLTP